MFSELAGQPEWQNSARPRLLTSTLLAALATAAFILFVEFSSETAVPETLEVRLLESPEPVEAIDPAEPEPIVLAPEIEEPFVVETDTLEEIDLPPVQTPEEPVDYRPDWYVEMDKVVAAVVAEGQETWSVNPTFDEKRRQAAHQFRPSRAPVKKPIWENVERDQLGRTILVSGDCHRVIDDPSATRYEIHQTFMQYITFCSRPDDTPRELPWVDDIREQYAYLSDDPVILALARPQE